MIRAFLSAILQLGLIFGFVGSVVGTALAQQAADSTVNSQNTTELLKAIDQLLEQNRQLEQQTQKLQTENQQLIDQIRTIRKGLAEGTKQDTAAPPAAASGDLKSPETPNTSPRPLLLGTNLRALLRLCRRSERYGDVTRQT